MVTAYGAFHAAGAGLGLALAFRVADRAGLPRWRTTAYLVAGFAGAFAAAKLVGNASGDAGDVLRHGGSATFVVPAALALGPLAAALFRLPAGRSLDAACVGAAAGHAIARLGCVFAGCCAGGAVESPALRSVLASMGLPPVHPLPLYDSLALAAAVPFLFRAASGRSGTAAALFAAVWGATRLLLVPFRESEDPGGSAAAVLLAVVCVVAGAAALVLRRRV